MRHSLREVHVSLLFRLIVLTGLGRYLLTMAGSLPTWDPNPTPLGNVPNNSWFRLDSCSVVWLLSRYIRAISPDAYRPNFLSAQINFAFKD